MRIEPAVLDGDEGLRQIGRQILQRDIGAGHFAARRQHAAVEADDLDGRRPLGISSAWIAGRCAPTFFFRSEFPATGSAADARRPRPRRRPARSPPTGRAPRPSRTAGPAGAGARLGLALAAAGSGTRLALARRHRRRHRRRGLRLADDFFGLSSAAVTRSCGPRRNSASDAASPNCGSRRPPLFFRPHAIRNAHAARCGRLAGGFKAVLSDD